MLLLSCVLLPETHSARERGRTSQQRSQTTNTSFIPCATPQGPGGSGERVTRGREAACCAVRVASRIPAAEFFDRPCGLAPLLPARPPRMTRGADGDTELGDRRAGGIGRATRAHNRRCAIGGMFHRFHGCLLSHCRWVGCFVWPALRADCDGAEHRCPHGQRGACARGLRRSGTVRGPSRLSRPPTEHGSTV